MRIKKRLTSLLATLVLLLGIMLPINAYALPDFKETVYGIPTVFSPMFGTNQTAQVESSWNEPRVGGGISTPHRGVDQGVNQVAVGPMYSNATIYQQGGSATASTGYYQVISYVNSGTTFYTIYMHLTGAFPFSVNTPVYLSDTTATSGNTGNVPYHLHYELLSSIGSAPDYYRVTLNLANYSSLSIKNQFTVFKNFIITYTSPANLVKKVSIDAIDTDGGDAISLSLVDIYYRVHGTSTWYGPYAMTGLGTATYSLTGGYSGQVYDIIIAGRRETTEAWSTYPARHSGDDTTTGSSVPLSNFTDWDYMTTTF